MSKDFITYKTDNNRQRKVRRRTKSYRKKVIIYKLVCTLLTVVILVIAAAHIFTHKRSYRNTGIELYNQGKYEEAIGYFDRSLNEKQWFSENVDVDVLMYKASAFLRLGNYNEAKLIYDKLLNDYSEDYYYREDIMFLSELCSALTGYVQGDFAGSVDTLKQACDRGYRELAMYVAICCENMGNYDEMKTYLDVYANSCAPDAYLYYKYASCYILMGNYSLAVEAIKTGIAYNDVNYQQRLSYLQIMCYYKLGDYTNAYALSEAYVISYPNDEKGTSIHDFLQSRVQPDEEVINDIYNVNPSDDLIQDEESVSEELAQ